MAENSTRSSASRAAPDFRQRFTTLRHTPPQNFERALFFDCAPLHALFLALLADDRRAAHFAPDQELLARVANARGIEAIDAAISDFRERSENHAWLRRIGRVRISTRRLSRIAEQCFAPDRGSPTSAR